MKRILIVDDNILVAEALKDALEDLGHEVVVAVDPVEALDKARVFGPDVCLLDIQLPIMDGYELGRHLHELPRAAHAQLIAVTGYGPDYVGGRSPATGFSHHLRKPIDLDQLIAIISA